MKLIVKFSHTSNLRLFFYYLALVMVEILAI